MHYYIYWRRRGNPMGYARHCMQNLGAMHQGNGWVRQVRTLEFTPEGLEHYLQLQRRQYPQYEVRVEGVLDP